MNHTNKLLVVMATLFLTGLSCAATVQTLSKDYNGLGQLWHVYALNSSGVQVTVETYTYNPSGQIATVTDVNGKITSYNYDPLGRLQSVVDNSNNLNGAGSATTGYTYNLLDQIVTVTDPLNQTTTYQYDALGNLWKLTSPDTGVTTWLAYDGAGDPTAWTDARGNTVQAQYDAGNRLTGKQVTPAGKTAQQQTIYTWDTAAHGIGQLGRIDATAVNGQVVTTVFGYDASSNLASQSDVYNGQAVTVNYSRDSNNRPYQTQYPSGSVTSIQYNAFGQPSSLSYGGAVLASNITWQPFGPLASITWLNALTLSDSYDQNGRIANKGMADGNRVYTWNNDGSLHSIADPNPSLTQTLAADTFGRLNSWSQNGSSRTWQYDLDDNRTQQMVGTTTETDSYLHAAVGQPYSGNRLQSKTGSSPATYTYDASGNTIADANFSYSYDGYGRMSSAQAISGGATVASYFYNGLGQRVAKVAGSNTYRYTFDGSGHVLGEYNNGALIQETQWLGDRPVLTWRNENGHLAGYAVASDHLNTPRELVSLATGQILWRWDSEPYGVGAPTSGVSPNGVSVTYNLRFPGQVYDAETGLNYNYFRDYNPQTGRYVESDPIGLKAGVNTFAYAGAGPIHYVDPRGLLTAVIVGLPTSGNPFGHVAIAFSGEGIYSFGTNTPLGASLTDYLATQSSYRNSEVILLDTTPAQEQTMIQSLESKANKPLPDPKKNAVAALHDTCATRTRDALAAAGISSIFAWPNSPFPSDVAITAEMNGFQAYSLPLGASIPSQLSVFNPWQ